MKNDDLLQMLGDTIREPDTLDDSRLDRLAAGELSAAERDSLKDLELDGVDSETLLSAFEPLDSSAKKRAKEMFKSSVADARGGENNQAEGTSRPAGLIDLELQRSQRRRNWTKAIAVTIPLAAAAVALFVLPPSSNRLTPLPDFELEWRSGTRTLRSGGGSIDPKELPQLLPESGLDLSLRPAKRVSRPPRLQVFLVNQTHLRELVLPHEVSRSGTVTIRGNVGRSIHAPPGKYDLILVLRPPGAPPLRGADIDTVRDRRKDGRMYQVIRQPFELVAP